MFVVRLFLEVRTGLLYQFAQHRLTQPQFHLLVLHFPELQQLVHHAEHALSVALHDFQLTADTLADTFVLQDIVDRRHDECERRTELMTDIGEEPQFDVGYLLLHQHFLPQGVVDADTIDG